MGAPGLAHQSLKGAPWVGSYSVAQCIQHLMGQPLYCSAADVGVCGEWEAMVMAVSPMHDSAVSPCFHGCLISSTGISHHNLLSHIPSQSLHSQQQRLPWDCSTIPNLQLPAVAPSRRLAFLSGKCMAAARTVWFSFHLGFHRSAVSLSALNVSPLTQTIAPVWGSEPCFSFPHPPRTGPVLLTLLFFPLVLLPHRVLCGSVYSFPLLRYFCLL